MGRGISMTKLNCLQVKDSYIAAMEQKQVYMQEQVNDLQKALRRMNNQGPATDVSENQSVNNTRSLPKCYLVDWASVDVKVAEGRVVSAEADELVNGIPLGPHAVKVLVETAIKADTFLWRPAQNMFTLEDAVGEMIAWHSDHCIVATAGLIPEDNAPNSPFTGSVNKCKLMDYIKKEEVVAVGRWQTKEPKSLVNGLPLGPNAVKVYVDEVLNPTAYIWRPTVGKTTMEDFMNCYVAWPANCVVFESDMTDSPRRQQSDSKAVSSSSKNQKSPLTPPAPKKPFTPASPLRRSERNKFKPNQKIQLLDISGNNVVVAEGRWSSSNPEHLVHFQALGLGACRVFVDVVKVKDAAVWRTSSEIEYMEDALGSCLAWPEDKIITV
ncbi:uncharacterized protein LOC108834515 [Raphanus sativus]|nr:uncharacterized protein LOC108834515 [Raphanus sativus]